MCWGSSICVCGYTVRRGQARSSLACMGLGLPRPPVHRLTGGPGCTGRHIGHSPTSGPNEAALGHSPLCCWGPGVLLRLGGVIPKSGVVDPLGVCIWTQRALAGMEGWWALRVSVSGPLQLLTVVLTPLSQPVLDLPEFEGPWNVAEGQRCFRGSGVF